MTRRVECDVLVAGSGAGGMSAAITSAHHGLKVIVAESESQFGGTTAWAGGFMWIPGNPVAEREGRGEKPGQGRTYLKSLLGNSFDEKKIDAFLTKGPEMVSFFEKNTALQFEAALGIPDFYDAFEGSSEGGRIVGPAPFDRREAGPWRDKLRQPPVEFTLAGMMIASGADRWHFLNALRSPKSFIYVTRRILRHWVQLLGYGRANDIFNGTALMGRLGRSAADLGVDLRLRTKVVRLTTAAGRVTGAVVASKHGEYEIAASRGVVLATGGFSHDEALRRELFSPVAASSTHLSAMPSSADGDGIRLGRAVGARVESSGKSAGGWAPVSLVPRADGTAMNFPHLIDRGKPGLIAVLRDGRRFTNEAQPYQDFVEAMLQKFKVGDQVEAWLICDHAFQRRYGLGASKPFPMPLGPYLKTGYLKRGSTLVELARECGIDPDGLQEAVRTFNEDARSGKDLQFGRGSTLFQKAQGDPAHMPNPCVAPLLTPPFYAVKVVPGTMGTLAGMKTDEHARVLDGQGNVIQGLYAAGNDMDSVFGGHYPSGGVVIAPAMTFGYVSGTSLAAGPDGTR